MQKECFLGWGLLRVNGKAVPYQCHINATSFCYSLDMDPTVTFLSPISLDQQDCLIWSFFFFQCKLGPQCKLTHIGRYLQSSCWVAVSNNYVIDLFKVCDVIHLHFFIKHLYLIDVSFSEDQRTNAIKEACIKRD